MGADDSVAVPDEWGCSPTTVGLPELLWIRGDTRGPGNGTDGGEGAGNTDDADDADDVDGVGDADGGAAGVVAAGVVDGAEGGGLEARLRSEPLNAIAGLTGCVMERGSGAERTQ